MQVSKTIGIVAGLLVLLSAASASAGDWPKTFEPAAVASYLEGENRAVLVAAAGEVSPGLTEAAAALEAALRSSGKPKLVMGGSALGALSAASDPEVVQKAQAMPVDVVAVLRLFPGPAGKPATAVVTFYDKKGAAQVALTAEEGTAVAAREGGQTGAGAGVSSRAVAAAVETAGRTSAANTAAQEEYEKKEIWFQDAALVNMHTGAVLTTWSTPYRGKYKEPLFGADFYEAVGRPDLASSYRTRSAVKTTLALGGLTGLLAGSGIATWGLIDGCAKKDAATMTCLERDGKLTTGIVLAAVGTTAMIANAFVDLHPVDLPTARKLVDDHNAKLKKDLGITAQAPAREERSPVAMQLGGYLGREGGGLTLTLSL